mgnify:CR=1 FL=1
MGIGLLTSCGETNSIAVADQTIEVGDVIEPEVVFTPADSVDTYTFTAPEATVAQPAIVTIRNHAITGVRAGVVTVTCATVNTGLETTFTVTVTAPTTNPTMDAFNEAGTFENGLTAWTLTGTTASVMATDVDNDRAQTDQQLRLYTGGEIDFTISYNLQGLPAGTYTISFEISAGQMTNVDCSIDEAQYSWADSEIVFGTSKYTANFFLVELTETTDVGFGIYFYAGASDGGWGFVDNIKIETGDTRPEEPQGYQDYVTDGSFEAGNLDAWIKDGACGGTLVVKNNEPHSGSNNLDYWGNDIAGDDFYLYQTIATVAAGSNYIAKVYVINGDNNSAPLTSAYLYVMQGENTDQVNITVTGYDAGYIEYTISGISLNATQAVTIGVHFQPGSAKYWMQLDDIQLLNLDQPLENA